MLTPATLEPAQTAVTAALTVAPTMRGEVKRSRRSRASVPDASRQFLLTRRASRSSPCPPLTWATTGLWWGLTQATRLSLFPGWIRLSRASAWEGWEFLASTRAPALSRVPPLPPSCRVCAGTPTVWATPVYPISAEATATPASTTPPPPSNQTSHWCTPPTRSTPSTRAPACPPPCHTPSTPTASCSPTTPCPTPVTGCQPGGPATNVSPRRRSCWLTCAHTHPCLWGWTVSCSRFPPLDLPPATSTSPTRAAQAPCPAPSPSGLHPAWV